MKISFIIPIYKVEQYLVECVQSILKQTYKDYEILLVDDGSPDNCPVICDELAKIDCRVKALHKTNGGLSDARNYGLQRAIGEYVVFIDGDDFWQHEDDLQKLVNHASAYPEVDFIGFNCDYYYPDSKTYTPWVAYIDSLSVPTDKNTTTCELIKSGTFPMSACLKLIKRQFLMENKLFFIKGQIAEDILWFINMLDVCKSCMFVNEYIYAYRQNVAGSITNLGGERSFNCLFNIVKTELSKIGERSFSQEAKDAIMSFLAYEYSILLSSSFNRGNIKKELHQYKYLFKYTMNSKVKMVSCVNNLFGIRITEFVLGIYQKTKKYRR